VQGLTLWRSAIDVAPRSYAVNKAYASALNASDARGELIDSVIAVAERGVRILENPPLRSTGWSRRSTSICQYYRAKPRNSSGAARRTPRSMDREIARGADARARRGSGAKRSRAHGECAPGHREEEIADVGYYPLYLSIGNTQIERGDWAAAAFAAREAAHLMPDAQEAYLVEGAALFYARRPDSAAVVFAAGLLLDERSVPAWENLAACFRAMNLQPPVAETSGARHFEVRSPLTRNCWRVPGRCSCTGWMTQSAATTRVRGDSDWCETIRYLKRCCAEMGTAPQAVGTGGKGPTAQPFRWRRDHEHAYDRRSCAARARDPHDAARRRAART